MLMEPVAAHRCGGNETDRLVIRAQAFVRPAVPPRRGAERFRPCIGVAPALDADEHGGGGVLVRLGIAAGLVLAYPEIEAIAGHERLDPAVAGRAAVIERKLGGGAVRGEGVAPHSEPPER